MVGGWAASGWEFFTFGVPGDDGLYPEGVRESGDSYLGDTFVSAIR